MEQALTKQAAEKIPELNQWLHGIEAEAQKRGYPNLFVAASDPKHPLGGGSVFRTGDTKDSEVFHQLRAILVDWEKQQGMDPTHDWRQKQAFHDGYLHKEASLWGVGKTVFKASLPFRTAFWGYLGGNYAVKPLLEAGEVDNIDYGKTQEDTPVHRYGTLVPPSKKPKPAPPKAPPVKEVVT